MGLVSFHRKRFDQQFPLMGVELEAQLGHSVQDVTDVGPTCVVLAGEKASKGEWGLGVCGWGWKEMDGV